MFGDHSSAIKLNKELWSWGKNSNGQLGDGTATGRSSPVLVVGGHLFIQTSNGASHTVAIKTNGEVWSFGWAFNGRLGNNSTYPNQSSPVAVVGNHSFTKTVAGSSFSLALKANGEVWSWGVNTWVNSVTIQRQIILVQLQ